jgi:hypothetical protein
MKINVDILILDFYLLGMEIGLMGSAEDAYSSMKPDSTFAFVGGGGGGGFLGTN